MNTGIYKNIIFIGMINSIKEYYDINQLYPYIFELKEDIVSYNDKTIIITKELIRQYFGKYKDINELREKAYQYYRKNIQGKPVDIGKYKNIRIARKSAERYKHYGADERKLLIVPKLREILETSKYKDSESYIKKEMTI